MIDFFYLLRLLQKTHFGLTVEFPSTFKIVFTGTNQSENGVKTHKT